MREGQEERPEDKSESKQRTHNLCKGPVVNELGAFQKL